MAERPLHIAWERGPRFHLMALKTWQSVIIVQMEEPEYTQAIVVSILTGIIHHLCEETDTRWGMRGKSQNPSWSDVSDILHLCIMTYLYMPVYMSG